MDLGACCACGEWKRDDQDDRLAKEYQPKTQMPATEARIPKWSMSNPAGHCFISAEYDRKNESIRITAEDTFMAKDVTCRAEDFINEMGRMYVGPQKLVFLRRARTPNGLTPAPAFAEAGKHRNYNHF